MAPSTLCRPTQHGVVLLHEPLKTTPKGFVLDVHYLRGWGSGRFVVPSARPQHLPALMCHRRVLAGSSNSMMFSAWKLAQLKDTFGPPKNTPFPAYFQDVKQGGFLMYLLRNPVPCAPFGVNQGKPWLTRDAPCSVRKQTEAGLKRLPICYS